MSFSTVLKKLIESSFPNHKLIRTSKGPGPELSFQIGDTIHGAKEILFIYKNNWDKSFYIHLQIIFEIPTKGNKSLTIVYNYIPLGDSENLKDKGLNPNQDLENQNPTYRNDDELKHIVIMEKEKILALEDWFFKSQRIKYKEIADICSHIPIYYKNWHDVKDNYNYDKKMLEQLKLEYLESCSNVSIKDGPERYQNPYHNMIDYDKFRCYLIMNKLIDKQPTELLLWRYWIFDRPFTKNDFIKDEPYYCYQCNKFLSRGDYIKMNDKIFGDYYEFICSKCLKKRNEVY